VSKGLLLQLCGAVGAQKIATGVQLEWRKLTQRKAGELKVADYSGALAATVPRFRGPTPNDELPYLGGRLEPWTLHQGGQRAWRWQRNCRRRYLRNYPLPDHHLSENACGPT
jgi:hypothetical protein